MLKFAHLISCGLLIAAAPLFAQNYTCEVFSLGNAGALGLNNAGQLVTTVRDGSTSRGYLRQPDGTSVLFDYPGATGTYATSINNNGQILGSFPGATGPVRTPFLRFPDGSFQLVTQAVRDNTPAGLTAVNDNLDLGGTIYANTGYLQGYDDVVIQDTAGNVSRTVRMPGSHDNTVTRTVTALNNARDFVAYNASGGFGGPASLVGYRSQLIGIFFPGIRANFQGSDFASYVRGLNNNGVIAGHWRASPNQTAASLFAFTHQMDGTSYPTVSCDEPEWDGVRSQMQAMAINDKGQVAGTMGTGANTSVFIATPTGTAPDLYLSNDSWTFSASPVGVPTGDGVIYITNYGSGMLHIVNLDRLDAMVFGDNASDFRVTGTTCPPSLGINHTCSISFNFTPSATGNRTANIVLADNSPSGPHIIPIQGMGSGSTLEIATTTIQFPAFPVGQQSGQIVIYPYVNGDQPMDFAPPRIIGLNASDFQVASSTCGATLQPYTVCQIAFTFRPSAPGWRWATLIVTADYERQIPLYGTGF